MSSRVKRPRSPSPSPDRSPSPKRRRSKSPSSEPVKRARKSRFSDPAPPHVAAPPPQAQPNPALAEAVKAAEKVAKLAAMKHKIANNMAKLKGLQTKVSSEAEVKPQSDEPKRMLVSSRPMALLLDDQGRQVDARGNLIVYDKTETATTLANRRKHEDEIKQIVEPQKRAVVEDITQKQFFDPRMRAKLKTTRKTRTIEFVKPGKFVRRADNMRHRQIMKDLGLPEKLAAEMAEEMEGDAEAINPNMIELATQDPKREKEAKIPPTVEWWDMRVLPKTSRDNYENNVMPWGEGSQAQMLPIIPTRPPPPRESTPNTPNTPAPSQTTTATAVVEEDMMVDQEGEGEKQKTEPEEHDEQEVIVPDKVDLLKGWNYQVTARIKFPLRFAVRGGAITHFVEHPIPYMPPSTAKAKKVVPVMLTKKEQKRLRRRNRAEREKEKQDRIRMGLLDAPAPKVKLSNMMRVLGQDAIKDPTRIEQEVRKQVAARQLKHEQENESRKLSKEQKTAKLEKKLFATDTKLFTVVLYRIKTLSDPQQKYKVDINAQQNRLTGFVAVTPQFSLLVAEGVPKSIARYRKLLERRIKWTERCAPRDGDQRTDQDEELDNECNFVWEGLVPAKTFTDFRFQVFASMLQARSYFEKKKVPQYFEMCRNFKSIEDEC